MSSRKVHLYGPAPTSSRELQATLCGRPVYWPTRQPLHMAEILQRPATCTHCLKNQRPPGPPPAADAADRK